MDNLGFNKRMKILITGDRGYLGNKIAQSMLNKNIRFYPNKANLLDLKETEFFGSIKPDCIIHCAAAVPRNDNDYYNEKLARKPSNGSKYH